MKHDDFDEGGFDARLRQHHAEAVAKLGASTRVQLRLGLRQALAGPRPWPVPPWALATAAALLLALGLQWHARQGQPGPVAPAHIVATDDVATGFSYDDNPDFYLWLASNDAATLAKEHR